MLTIDFGPHFWTLGIKLLCDRYRLIVLSQVFEGSAQESIIVALAVSNVIVLSLFWGRSRLVSV